MKTILFSLTLLLATKFMVAQTNLNIDSDLLVHLDKNLAPFYHGVASGDPTQNSIVIWTKLTLDKEIKTAQVDWEICTDKACKKVLKNFKHFF
jgi:alkaline phosphatase D